MSTKKEIINLLSTVKRDNMDCLIDWLENKTDFFTAPSSTKYHGNYDGGLADHSLNVYDSLVLLHTEYINQEDRYPQESIIITSLLHDLCKIDYYIKDEEPATSAQLNLCSDLLEKAGLPSIPKNQKTKGYLSKVIDALKNDRDVPEFTNTYKVDDRLPMGHGEKSLFIIQKFIDLTEPEALAIRWHLGGYDPGFHFGFPSGWAVKQAIKDVPLVPLLITADFMATWLVDITR